MIFEGVLEIVFKAFAVVLGIIYLIFSIVLFRQTQVMTRTLLVGKSWIIVLVSFLQIVFALILIAIAFTLL